MWRIIGLLLVLVGIFGVVRFYGPLEAHLADPENYRFPLSAPVRDRAAADIDLLLARYLPGDAAARREQWIAMVEAALEAEDIDAVEEYLAAAPALLGSPWQERFALQIAPEASVEARDSAAIALAETWLPDESAARYRELIEPAAEMRRTGREFAEGFLKGEVDSTAALAGTITADFMVWGDIRDLTQQSFNALTGEPVDEVIYVLSGIGLGLTAATVATAGGAAAPKVGVSVLKAGKRAGRLTPPFAKYLGRQAQDALSLPTLRRELDAVADRADLRSVASGETLEGITSAWRRSVDRAAIDALSDDAATLARVAEKGSAKGALRLMRHVENATDLRRAELGVTAGGKRFFAAERLLGKQALSTLKGVLKTSYRLATLVGGGLLSLALILLGLVLAIRISSADRAEPS